MRKPDETEERIVKGIKVKVEMWYDEPCDSYQDVYGDPPPEDVEFCDLLAKATIEILGFSGVSAFNSLGFVESGPSNESRKHCREEMKLVSEQAVEQAVKQLYEVAEGKVVALEKRRQNEAMAMLLSAK